MGAREGEEWGAAFLLRGGAGGGPRGDHGPTPSSHPLSRPDAQPTGVRTAVRTSGACGRETQALYLVGSGTLCWFCCQFREPHSDWTLEAGDT